MSRNPAGAFGGRPKPPMPMHHPLGSRAYNARQAVGGDTFDEDIDGQEDIFNPFNKPFRSWMPELGSSSKSGGLQKQQAAVSSGTKAFGNFNHQLQIDQQFPFNHHLPVSQHFQAHADPTLPGQLACASSNPSAASSEFPGARVLWDPNQSFTDTMDALKIQGPQNQVAEP